MHDAGWRMAPVSQKQMAQFVRGEVPENQSQPHAAPVGELLRIVRENIGHGGEAPIFGIEGEAKAVLRLS